MVSLVAEAPADPPLPVAMAVDAVVVAGSVAATGAPVVVQGAVVVQGTVVQPTRPVTAFELGGACNGLVVAHALGTARTMSKRRQMVKLVECWRCSFCKAYSKRDEVKCGTCCAARPSATGGADSMSAREVARYEARKRLCIGRQHNKVASGER